MLAGFKDPGLHLQQPRLACFVLKKEMFSVVMYMTVLLQITASSFFALFNGTGYRSSQSSLYWQQSSFWASLTTTIVALTKLDKKSTYCILSNEPPSPFLPPPLES